MRNNKAFTLIEILAAITILAIISIITTTTVTNFIKKGKNDLFKKQLETIRLSSMLWVSDHKEEIDNINSDCISISLKTLEDDGYVEPGLKNPKTEEELDSDEYYVNVTKNNKKYIYEVDNDVNNQCDEYEGDTNEE